MWAQGSLLGTAWIFLVALVCAALGFRSTWGAAARLRAPASVDGALLWWEERPVPAFRQDPVVAVSVAVHTLAILAMAVLAVLLGIRALDAPPAWLPAARAAWSARDPIWLVYGAAVSLSAGLGWFVAGAVVALPVAGRRWSPVRMVLTEEGTMYGQLLMPWGMFGRLRQDGGGLLCLCSRTSPELAALTLRPPTAELLGRARQIVAERVPPLPGDLQVPWYRRKLVFGFLFVMTALPFVALGLAAYPSTEPWVWASQGMGAWLAITLGQRVVRAYH